MQNHQRAGQSAQGQGGCTQQKSRHNRALGKTFCPQLLLGLSVRRLLEQEADLCGSGISSRLFHPNQELAG